MRFTTKWLGLTDYREACELQTLLAAKVKLSGGGVVLGLEHPEVVTLGIRGGNEDLIQVPKDVPVIRSSRGGQATYHNPGQLVIYPVCPIGIWNLGPREWVDLLLKTTHQTLVKCNIIVVAINSGIYTPIGKIAALGLDLKGKVSTHGIAVNISNDLSGFSQIRACGREGQAVDRVGDHHQIGTEAFFALWCEEFRAVLEAKQRLPLTSPTEKP